MGLFGKSKDKTDTPVLKQDLSKKETPGMVFLIHLLMQSPCPLPSKEAMTAVMEKHLGPVDCFACDGESAGFAPQRYRAEFKDGSLPPQLFITKCIKADGYHIDELTRSQMWDCPDSETILAECPYQIIATDMLGGAIPNYKDRANMLMDFTEALVELFPQCRAVQFQTSGKMFTREQIADHHIPREDRFVYFAVNVRFFRIEGAEDLLVDSLGMSTLYLPDVQYHFHGMDPNWVVRHAYNLLSYLYAGGAPIKSGETVDGVADGRMSRDVQWVCQYESALIQPAREVLDVNMGPLASGRRQ